MEAAAKDNHRPIAPSHYVEKDGRVVGLFNTGHTVHWWMDSKKCSRDDSRFAFMALETLQHQQGIQLYAILCATESPYKPVMEKFGFLESGTTNLFVRKP